MPPHGPRHADCYVFGNMAWVQQNFGLIVWLMTVVPGAIALLGAWRAKSSAAQG